MIVLLKHSSKALSLNINQLTNKNIALIGPTANTTRLMQGNYFRIAPHFVSAFVGFQTIVQGSLFICMNKLLPDIQMTLLQALEKVARSPIHVVLAGSSLDLSYIRDSPQHATL